MQHYLAALPYRDLIVGIGLDSNEEGRPPSLFEETYLRARADGFRLTSHCDVGPAYPLSHIHQVLRSIGGSGAERIDHGLNATDSTDLVAEIVERGVGMTVCPWSYIRHQPFDEVFARIRVLFDAGAKMAIGSDDPAFMEDTWIYENFVLLRECGGFSEGDMLKLARDAVEVCWAEEEVKRGILEEIEGLERVVEGG
jgi:adenosine deaminase